MLLSYVLESPAMLSPDFVPGRTNPALPSVSGPEAAEWIEALWTGAGHCLVVSRSAGPDRDLGRMSDKDVAERDIRRRMRLEPDGTLVFDVWGFNGTVPRLKGSGKCRKRALAFKLECPLARFHMRQSYSGDFVARAEELACRPAFGPAFVKAARAYEAGMPSTHNVTRLAPVEGLPASLESQMSRELMRTRRYDHIVEFGASESGCMGWRFKKEQDDDDGDAED